ncbi:MAG: hypothetical protein LKG27_00275 [Clostridiaceae bacterium]|jgi:hypothetical protein|nr:hypothetical protein [Clostridiaceae bacterium]
MSNISFTANLQGVDSDALKTLFKSRTSKLPFLTMERQKAADISSPDTFNLIKDDKVIASSEKMFNEQRADAVSKLVSIFDGLRAKFALSQVKKMKEEKRLDRYRRPLNR